MILQEDHMPEDRTLVAFVVVLALFVVMLDRLESYLKVSTSQLWEQTL